VDGTSLAVCELLLLLWLSLDDEEDGCCEVPSVSSTADMANDDNDDMPLLLRGDILFLLLRREKYGDERGW